MKNPTRTKTMVSPGSAPTLGADNNRPYHSIAWDIPLVGDKFYLQQASDYFHCLANSFYVKGTPHPFEWEIGSMFFYAENLL